MSKNKKRHQIHPPQTNNTSVSHSRLISSVEFSGPLPLPSIIREYEAVLPGAADRIITMAEEQARHRQALEKKYLGANSTRETLGMCFAFIIVFVLMLVGAFLLYDGKSTAGYIAILVPLGGVAGMFIWKKRDERKELERKKDELQ